MSSSSLRQGYTSRPMNDFLHIGQDVIGALTEVPYVGPIFQVLEKILEIREEVKDNTEQCEELLQTIQDHTRTLFEALDKLAKSPHADRMRSIENDLHHFKSILESIVETLSKLSPKRKRDRWRQIFNRAQIKDDIAKCERELRRFHERFTIGTLTKLAMDVFEASELSTRRQALTQLPYAERASWNPELCCLDGTREDLLRDIFDWFEPFSERSTTSVQARIRWLQGPAGSGKSAVAHSVAACAAEQDILVSSFFLTPGTTTSQSASNQGASMQLPSLQNLVSTLLYDLSRRFSTFADAIAEELHNNRYLLSDPRRQFTELLVRYSHLLDTSNPLLWIIDGFDELRRCDDRSGGFSTRDILWLLEVEVPKLPSNFVIFVTSRPSIYPFLSSPPPHLHLYTLDLGSQSTKKDVELIVRAKMEKLAVEKDLYAWPDEVTLARFTSRADGLPLWVTVVTNFLRNSLRPQFDLDQILSSKADHHVDVDTDLSNDMGEIYSRVLDACADWGRKEHKKSLGRVLEILLALQHPLSLESLCELCHGDSLADIIPSIIQALRPVLIGLDSGAPIEFVHLSFRDFLVSPAQKIVQIDLHIGHATLAHSCFQMLNSKLAADCPKMSWGEHERDPNPPFLGHPNPSASLMYSSALVMEHLSHLPTRSPEKLTTSATIFLSSTILHWLDFQTCFGEYFSVLYVAERVMGLGISEAQIDGWITRDVVVQIIMEIGSWLSSVNRLEESLASYEDSTRILRLLASEHAEAFDSLLAISLNDLSIRFSDLGFREKALQTNQEAVELHRRLASENSLGFNPELARSLNSLSIHLSDLGLREEALQTIQEAVEHHRNLASEYPGAFTSQLSRSLNTLSNCFYDLGFRDKSLQAIQEAVDLRRQLASEHPQAYTPSLARSLHNLSSSLSDVGLPEKALQTIQEAVELRRGLASENPQAFNAHLAESLDYFSFCLSEVGSRDEALKVIQEAVELHRRLASERPQVFNPALAGSLYTLSSSLSGVGLQEEALQIIQEAVELYRRFASESPQAFNPELARSLNSLSVRLSDLGFREEALQTIQEAVEHHRRLASEHQEAFNSELSRSLNTLSNCLYDLGFREESLQAIQEAVKLRRRLASEHPQAFNSSLASSLHNLSSSLSDLDLPEDALQAIQESVELRRRLASEHPQTFNADLAESLESLSNSLSDVGSRDEALKVIQEALELHRCLASERPQVFNSNLARSLFSPALLLDDLGRPSEVLSVITEAARLYESLVTERPLVFQSSLNKALGLQSRIQEQLGVDADIDAEASLSTAGASET